MPKFEEALKQYLLTSGMTGYVPNPSEVAVFKVPDKDLYIALADRWDPNNLLTKDRTEAITRVVASQFDKSIQVQEGDYGQMIGLAFLERLNTSISDYVWLPIRFEKDRAVFEWKDEWKIEDYQKGWNCDEKSGV